MSFDAAALNAVIDYDALRVSHPCLFSQTALTIAPETAEAIAGLIAAIESVVALPVWQETVLGWAPEIARKPVAARGVFFGYDVHLTVDGPQLIEINTNAGGALLNARLLAAHGRAAEGAALEAAFVEMFRSEWRLARGEVPLQRIAIVDEAPGEQYLAPEFVLFKQVFEAHGIAAVIADPSELKAVDGRLLCHGEPVDLVYNRLTDFALNLTVNADLRAIFEAGGVVVTPHPRAHALYADKRNLRLLSDEAWLTAAGVPAATREVLLRGVPRTVEVAAEDAERFWSERKQWFFKPAAGFGSRATYRGDKLTRRVFEEILQGGYIAQRIALPGDLTVDVENEAKTMKYDVRAYVYDGAVQLLVARLYQGQTTNFRTPGGGFAPVFVKENA